MNYKLNVFAKFVAFGVVSRAEVKNNLPVVRALMKEGVVKKVYKKGKVFYELTEDAVPLLDVYRKMLLEQARLYYQLHPRRRPFYNALLEDVRFLDTSKADAQNFQFLGDWRLLEPPLLSQLQLAQWRFYQEMGFA